MAEHEHLYHEATDDPQACPDEACWWNEEESHIGPGRYTELTVKDGPEFPEGFQGAGPMYAAIPLGAPWLDAATRGATTYVLRDPGAILDPASPARHDADAGWSAFLDRGQAEQVADHPDRSGEFIRWEGLTGWSDWTDKAEREYRQAEDAWTARLEAGQ